MSLMALLSTALRPIVVRKLKEHELLIEVVHGANRRALKRPALEELHRSLTRLHKALGMPLQLLDECGDAIAGHTPALHAWRGAAYLCAGDDRAPVWFDPPEVSSLECPSAPHVAIPLCPLLQLRYCEAEEVRLSWETRGEGGGWQPVGELASYVPTDADEGAELRVRAVAGREPSAIARELLERTLELGVVRRAPPRPALARRLAAFAADGGVEPRGKIRVMSYNLLAQTYQRGWDGAGGVHSYCPPDLTAAASRLPRQLAEVLSFSPDVLCMQEVDARTFESHWKPQLEARGYTGAFSLKRGVSSSEGCALFVDRRTFELQQMRIVPLDLQDTSAPLRRLLEAHPATCDAVQSLPTIAQLALLRHVDGRTLLVANTHLYYAHRAVHVRLMQIGSLLHHAHAWTDALDAPRPPLVLAGDLNCASTHGAVQLLLQGEIRRSHRDWMYGYLYWREGIGVEKAARDAAACTLRRRGVESDEGCGVEGDEARSAEVGEAADEAQQLSLRSALAVAQRFHLLRLAAQRLLREEWRLSSQSPEAVPAEASAFYAAAVSDFREGKTLLTSTPLAALEVAEVCGVQVEQAGGLHFAISFVPQERMADLDGILRQQIEELRQLADTFPTETGVDLYPGVELASIWQLQSAYGRNTVPTHVLPDYQDALDWIWFDKSHLRLAKVAPLPSREECMMNTAMPSAEFPSDHVSLCADLTWIDQD
ncbi:hypothetical protein AB1Y20_022817 [Prymnesium parvum]|uniref:Endonuclease/exonuclease/phosphatase domain-containing protein n=1 Tax=Prymnesium parvum TaxID=97485 RepID=A0AB34JD88_PRYPA